jgi:hypothetical protein
MRRNYRDYGLFYEQGKRICRSAIGGHELERNILEGGSTSSRSSANQFCYLHVWLQKVEESPPMPAPTSESNVLWKLS